MTESPRDLFQQLLDIMARLRGADGCPWDREQTRSSLKPFLLEEAYEVLEAIEDGDESHLAEELGDVLLQVVFHAQIGAEDGTFDMAEVLRRLNDKLTRRHPHVFGDARAATAGDVLRQWELLKVRESEQAGRRRSLVDGVPRALPALLRAQRTQGKAARVRFDWPDAAAALDKVEEELREAREAMAGGDPARVREELGDVLFSTVNAARLAAVDAEDALHSAIEKFRERFGAMEAALAAQGKSVTTVDPDELERSWQTAKARERKG